MHLEGPDLLIALGFALGGLALGLVCGVAIAFWLAGLGPEKIRRDSFNHHEIRRH